MALPGARSALIFSFLLLTTSYPWARFAKSPFLPARAAFSFAQHLITARAMRPRLQDVFLEVPELRSLALPPSAGGPPSPGLIIWTGCGLAAAFALALVPATWAHLLSLAISGLTAVGFATALSLAPGIGYSCVGPGVVAHLAVAVGGMLCIALRVC
jgi:hypothetical protein